MTAEPSQRRAEDAGISELEAYLETVHLPQGSCLMREGSPGDARYLIVSGEIRTEVERPDFDSNGVISFMGPDISGPVAV